MSKTKAPALAGTGASEALDRDIASTSTDTPPNFQGPVAGLLECLGEGAQPNLIDLRALAAAINGAHEQATNAFSSGFKFAISAGDFLLLAKAQMKHGEWVAWLTNNVTVTPRTAQLYMRLAREVPKLGEEKAKRVSLLSLRGAIRTLASESGRINKLPPNVIDEVFNNEHDGDLLRASRQAETVLSNAARRKRLRAIEAKAASQRSAPSDVVPQPIVPPRPSDFDLQLGHVREDLRRIISRFLVNCVDGCMQEEDARLQVAEALNDIYFELHSASLTAAHADRYPTWDGIREITYVDLEPVFFRRRRK